jgi:hypothetical protein
MKNIFTFSLLALSLSSFAQNKNYAEPNVKWSKTQVSVCWGKYQDRLNGMQKFDSLPFDSRVYLEYSASEKANLMAMVNKEFTKTKTGLEFIGWKDCSETKNPDVTFFKINDPRVRYAGRATIGESGLNVSESFQGRVRSTYQKKKASVRNFLILNTDSIGYPALPYEQDLKLVFLHEIGHTAGLRHEHIDMQAKASLFLPQKDKNCVTAGINSSELPIASTMQLGVYDANSVMNYCYIFLLEKIGLEYSVLAPAAPGIQVNLVDPAVVTTTQTMGKKNYRMRIGLSSGDQHALKCMYQFDAKTFLAKCHGSFDPKPKNN